MSTNIGMVASDVRIILETRTVNEVVYTAREPVYATPLSAGADVHAFCPGVRIVVKPGEIAMVPTGLQVAIDGACGLFVLPRSGLSSKKIKVANAPGLVDADYRNEVKVLIHNESNEDFVINHEDRIAQLVLMPVFRMQFARVGTLEETDRKGGFGHTGVGAL